MDQFEKKPALILLSRVTRTHTIMEFLQHHGALNTVGYVIGAVYFGIIVWKNLEAIIVSAWPGAVQFLTASGDRVPTAAACQEPGNSSGQETSETRKA